MSDVAAIREINSEFIDELLALTAFHQRVAFTRAANLFHTDGLAQLLDAAARLVGSNPGKARQLAVLGAEMASGANAPALVPRATYIRAQTHATNAEFETALDLIESARQGYLALGDRVAALRTNVGRMHVLSDLGRYQEDLETGQAVLNALKESAQFDGAQTSPSINQLIALVYQNTGACYEQMGRYADALSAYAAAEERYRALNLPERIGSINNNRGVVLLNLGRVREALAALESAADIFAQAQLTLRHAQALINIGDAELLSGNYASMLAAFDQARRLLVPLDAQVQKHELLLDMADAYLALNLYPEALSAYREADELARTVGMTRHRARALWGIGAILIAQSQFDAAERVLAEAATLFTTAQNVPLLSSVMLKRAALLAGRGDRGAALATARQALAIVSGNDWALQQVQAHLLIADLLLPDTAKTQPHLRQAQGLVERLGLDHLRYLLNQRLGHMHLLLGHDAEAESSLQAAIDEIERLRGNLAQERMRAFFHSDKILPYDDLMQLYLGRGDDENVRRAFVITERAKSRVLVDVLRGAVEARFAAPTDSALAMRLRAAQTELDATYTAMLIGSGDGKQKNRLPDLQDRSIELEREISRLQLQVPTQTATAPNAFETWMPSDAILAQLNPEIILLSFHICDEEIIAFAHLRGKVQVVRHLSTVSKIQQLAQKLAQQWDRFRIGREFVEHHQAQLEQSARHALASLYAELIQPLEALLPDAGADDPPPSLVIVPHGLLHQIPFHALFDGARYLLERFEISYAPSATVLALCQQRAPLYSERALVMGVADELIPAAATEARRVAPYLAGGKARTDEQATLAILQSDAPGCAVIHLACHGLFRADNPMFSSLKLSDGWLMATDVMQLDLSGALVTLSACESGRSQVIAGDEILGLTRAFLGAGAATLIVSQWLVQDDTTVKLMEELYAQLRQSRRPAAALRLAQMALKAEHPHPYYWAPFVVVGRR